MSTRQRVAALVACACTVAGCGGAPTRPDRVAPTTSPAPQRTEDPCDSVRAATREQLQALAERDAERYLASFVEGPDILVLGATDVAVAAGSEAVARTLRRAIGELSAVEVEATERGCGVVGESAWTLHEVVFRPTAAAAEAEGLPEQLTYHLAQVHRRVDGAWKVAVASWALALTPAQVREWTDRADPAPPVTLEERRDPGCDDLASALGAGPGAFEVEAGPAPTPTEGFATPGPPTSPRLQRVGDLCVALATAELPFAAGGDAPIALPVRVLAIGAAEGTGHWLRVVSVVVPEVAPSDDADDLEQDGQEEAVAGD